MEIEKNTAKIAGILLILNFLIGVFINLLVIGPLTFADEYLVKIAPNTNQLITGVLFYLIGAGLYIGVAVILFPFFKKVNHSKTTTFTSSYERENTNYTNTTTTTTNTSSTAYGPYRSGKDVDDAVSDGSAQLGNVSTIRNISSTQIWLGMYQNMDNLRFAPSYIDGNGQPCYEQPTTSQDEFCH